MSKKHWMHAKKITMNKLDPNGKPVIQSVTVAQFVEMYNTQNMVFTRTTQYSQILLGQLYIENPNNPFFKKVDAKLLKYAKEKAAKIKENPELGILEFKEVPKEKPKEKFEKTLDNVVPLNPNKKEDEKPCEHCGQVPNDKIYGEYPCPKCGMPTTHDGPKEETF